MFPTRSSRFTRTLITVAAASSLGVLAACGGSGDSLSIDPVSTIPAGAVVVSAPTATTDSGATLDAQEETEDDDSSGFPDQGPVEQPPVGNGDSGAGVTPLEPVAQPSGPCAQWVSGGAALVVGPDPHVLEAGAMTAEISVTNCTAGTVDWTAKSVAVVDLEMSAGSLTAGQTATLIATIDDDTVGPGAVDVKVKVSEPGHNHYVDIHAYDPLVGSDLVAGGGNLSPGADAMGCALQCITKALLRPNLSNANVSLDVATTVPTAIEVWVSTDEPVIDDATASFPGVAPLASMNEAATEWTASLAPLEAATTYNIIVAATDDNDHTAYRVGHFTTRSPIDNPGGLAGGGGDSGCAAQCITKAIVTTHDDGTAELDVESHTPATFQAFVSLDGPTYDGHVPGFAETVAWANSGLQHTDGWATTIGDLAPDTTHHIIVMATDAEGRASYQVGQFHTPLAPVMVVKVGMHQVRITNDGDSGANRGEISLAWGTGGTVFGSAGEGRYDTGAVLGFGDWETYNVVETSGFVPTIYLDVFERDADGKIEFCETPYGIQEDAGTDGDCDLNWSVGSTGIIGVETITGLPLCVELGLDVGIVPMYCMEITAVGGDATASAIVSFEVDPGI